MVMKFFIISVCLSMLLFACSKQDNSDNLPVFPDLPHSKIIESAEVGYLDDNNEFFTNFHFSPLSHFGKYYFAIINLWAFRKLKGFAICKITNNIQPGGCLNG